MKKTELVYGIVFLITILLERFIASYPSVITNVITMAIVLLIIIDIRKNPFLEVEISTALVSTAYKVFIYIALLFRVLHYPGEDLLVVVASALVIGSLVYMILRKHNNLAWKSFIYFQSLCILYILFMP